MISVKKIKMNTSIYNLSCIEVPRNMKKNKKWPFSYCHSQNSGSPCNRRSGGVREMTDLQGIYFLPFASWRKRKDNFPHCSHVILKYLVYTHSKKVVEEKICFRSLSLFRVYREPLQSHLFLRSKETPWWRLQWRLWNKIISRSFFFCLAGHEIVVLQSGSQS